MIKKYRQCTVTVCMFDICLCLSLSGGPLELFFGRSALWVSWESNKTDHRFVELSYKGLSTLSMSIWSVHIYVHCMCAALSFVLLFS